MGHQNAKYGSSMRNHSKTSVCLGILHKCVYGRFGLQKGTLWGPVLRLRNGWQWNNEKAAAGTRLLRTLLSIQRIPEASSGLLRCPVFCPDARGAVHPARKLGILHG